MNNIRLDILIVQVLKQITKDLKRYIKKMELNEKEKEDIKNIKLFLETELFVYYCDFLNLDYVVVKNNFKKLLNKI